MDVGTALTVVTGTLAGEAFEIYLLIVYLNFISHHAESLLQIKNLKFPKKLIFWNARMNLILTSEMDN
jgi:predicted proteasome-type protease